MTVIPRTSIFGGKAVSACYMVIPVIELVKFINSVVEIINRMSFIEQKKTLLEYLNI